MDRTVSGSRFLLGLILAISVVSPTISAQTWQPVTTPAPLGVGSMLLMTDGRVLVHAEQDNPQIWYTLTPDSTGSYVHGTWKQVASMPAAYAPLFFGSAVLKNGNVIVEGGEYNNGSPAWTTLGAMYNPVTNKWVSIAPLRAGQVSGMRRV